MKVKDLIIHCYKEELGIKIYDSDNEKLLIPNIWKTDYLLINPITEKYRYEPFHKYDDIEIYGWEIENGELFIYI